MSRFFYIVSGWVKKRSYEQQMNQFQTNGATPQLKRMPANKRIQLKCRAMCRCKGKHSIENYIFSVRRRELMRLTYDFFFQYCFVFVSISPFAALITRLLLRHAMAACLCPHAVFSRSMHLHIISTIIAAHYFFSRESNITEWNEENKISIVHLLHIDFVSFNVSVFCLSYLRCIQRRRDARTVLNVLLYSRLTVRAQLERIIVPHRPWSHRHCLNLEQLLLLVETTTDDEADTRQTFLTLPILYNNKNSLSKQLHLKCLFLIN